MTLQFGLCTPSNFWSLDWAARQQTLAEINDAGFNHVFIADHVSFRNGSGTDGFVEVASLSQLHPSIGVMISIYLLPLRHPLPVARQLASMQQVAPGRMLFGVGVGGDDRHEVEVCGVNPRTRGKRANESLHIIRELLAGEEVTFKGEEFDIEAAKIRPRQQQQAPIIVGGRSAAALTRTGRYGDGWIGVWVSPERYADAIAGVTREAAQCNRANIEWLHGYQPWIGVDQNRDVARQVVAEQMERFYHVPFEKFERYTPFGTPADVAEQLAAYHQSGARLFNLKICTKNPEEEVALAAEVLQLLANST